MLHQLLHDEAPLARAVKPGVSRDLEAVLAKALSRSAERRYATMADFASDLERVGAGRASRRAARGPARPRGEVGAPASRGRGARRVLVAFFAVAGVVTLVKNRRLERYLERAGLESARSVDEARAAQAHLVRHTRLADHRRLEDLESRARALVPPSPELVPSLRDWQRAAEALAKARRPSHGARRPRRRGNQGREHARAGRLARRSAPHRRLLTPRASAGERAPAGREIRSRGREEPFAFVQLLESSLARVQTWSYDDPADAWHDATLSAVVEGIDRFTGPAEGPLADVSRRIEDAGRSARLAEDRDSWERARASIRDRAEARATRASSSSPSSASCPSARIPRPDCGSSSTSSVETRARRGPHPGRPASCVTLVLIPGGRARVGARDPSRRSPGRPARRRPASPTESPVDEVPARPVLRLEVRNDQGPVASMLGGRPRAASPGSARGSPRRRRRLERSRARAARRARAADRGAVGVRRASRHLLVVLDGSGRLVVRGRVVLPAPMSAVGRLRPNAFGLFDVAGNVAEWCRDLFTRYEFPHAPGSGERSGVVSPPERD